MKSLCRITFVIICVTLLAAGCGDNQGPEYKYAFDGRLVGDWMYSTENPYNGMPDAGGIRILESGEIQWLAVDWETGVLTGPQYTADPARRYEFVSARRGQAVLFVPHQGWTPPPPTLEHELRYTVTETGLELDREVGFLKTRYDRSTTGTKIADPVHSEFAVIMNGGSYQNESFHNAVVSTRPSASGSLYQRSGNPPILTIVANGGKTLYDVYVVGLTGPGTYRVIMPVDPDETGVCSVAYYARGGGCVLPTLLRPARDGESGTITIDTYDVESGRCTGTIEASLVEVGDLEIRVSVTGKFDVPLYLPE